MIVVIMQEGCSSIPPVVIGLYHPSLFIEIKYNFGFFVNVFQILEVQKKQYLEVDILPFTLLELLLNIRFG